MLKLIESGYGLDLDFVNIKRYGAVGDAATDDLVTITCNYNYPRIERSII